MSSERWSDLGRTDLIDFGKRVVTERLERARCRVTHPHRRMDARLEVRSRPNAALRYSLPPSESAATCIGTKRRLEPASHRFAALVLLQDEPEPGLYLTASVDWLDPSPPLTAPDYEGLKPEYGIRIGPASLDALRRYAWTDEATRRHLA
jgi:hypothetical protein